MTETEVAVALTRIDEIWELLFPAEQARVVRLLVERVGARQRWSETGLQ